MMTSTEKTSPVSTYRSQFGEDAMVQQAFDRIGIKHKWCFEVGAMDGETYSNTFHWRSLGWRAVLIESDTRHVEKLREFTSDTVTVIHATIGSTVKLDDLLPGDDYDLGIIDIDGQDYWVWTDMVRVRPRVMIVEYKLHDTSSNIPPRDHDNSSQAGMAAIENLGASKGYRKIGQTPCNLVFVEESEPWD
jgi:hypothetical protein